MEMIERFAYISLLDKSSGPAELRVHVLQKLIVKQQYYNRYNIIFIYPIPKTLIYDSAYLQNLGFLFLGVYNYLVFQLFYPPQ